MLLGVWFTVGVVLLVVEPTMFRNHIATLVPPLALLAALHPPPWRAFAVLLLFLVPWWAVQLSDVLWPQGYTGDEKAVVAALRELPPGAQAISDEPGLLWRAGRRTPPWLNDGSVKRIQQGNITTDVVAREAARDDVCAAVVWSFRWGSELPGLPEALRDLGYTPVARYTGPRTLWVKPSCRP
jgi:hypothetical protein